MSKYGCFSFWSSLSYFNSDVLYLLSQFIYIYNYISCFYHWLKFLVESFLTSATEGGWRLCFLPCLSVCLFVCEQHSSNICRRIWTKFGGELGNMTRTNWFDFSEDPSPIIFLMILHHWVIGLKRYIAGYLKKLWTDQNTTWWMSWLGDKNKPIWFWFRFGFRSDPSVG